jgi:hypothetical protein
MKHPLLSASLLAIVTGAASSGAMAQAAPKAAATAPVAVVAKAAIPATAAIAATSATSATAATAAAARLPGAAPEASVVRTEPSVAATGTAADRTQRLAGARGDDAATPAAAVAPVAGAEPAPSARSERAPAAIGPSTRRWLELQRSNAQAGRAHPMDGEVAHLVYRRYLDSFRSPVAAPGGAAPSPARTEGAYGGPAASAR